MQFIPHKGATIHNRTIHCRYDSQIKLAEVGEHGQEKLKHARVLCVGAGGLGAPALQYLVGAGVGHIGIIDHDSVSLSNLHRQILFTENQIHQNKAEAARENLSKLNADIEITSYAEKLSSKNIEALFLKYDLILDCTDNFSARYLINDAAVKFKKRVIFATVTGFEGHLSVWDATQGPCYRCVYPEAHAAKTCGDEGILGSVAGVLGTLQATEALKALLGLPTLAGTLLSLDLRDYSVLKRRIAKNNRCSVCSQPSNTILLKDETEACSAIEFIRFDEITPDHIVIDVRKQPASNVSSTLKSKPLITVCETGQRSAQAAKRLKNSGFKNVRVYRGDIRSIAAE